MFLGELVCKIERKGEDKVTVRAIEYKTHDEEFNQVLLDYRGRVKYSSMIKKICEYNLYSNNAQNLIDKSRLNLSINEQEPILFVNDDDQTLSANNYSTCKQYVQMELVTYNPVSKGLRQLPPVNMIYFLYTFLYIFYITYKERTN